MHLFRRNCPLLNLSAKLAARIQRGESTMRFKKILIAVDESSVAAHAADLGLELARQLGGEAAFITVVDPTVVSSAPDFGVSADKWLAMAQREAKDLLKHLQSRATSAPKA
jgi:nucleotide-binding universal stress UspA family protein